MNYLTLDYDYYPAKAKIYQDSRLVKQWSERKPKDLIDSVVDSFDATGFEKVKIKRTLDVVIELFDPKKITIKENE